MGPICPPRSPVWLGFTLVDVIHLGIPPLICFFSKEWLTKAFFYESIFLCFPDTNTWKIIHLPVLPDICRYHCSPGDSCTKCRNSTSAKLASVQKTYCVNPSPVSAINITFLVLWLGKKKNSYIWQVNKSVLNLSQRISEIQQECMMLTYVSLTLASSEPCVILSAHKTRLRNFCWMNGEKRSSTGPQKRKWLNAIWDLLLPLCSLGRFPQSWMTLSIIVSWGPIVKLDLDAVQKQAKYTKPRLATKLTKEWTPLHSGGRPHFSAFCGNITARLVVLSLGAVMFNSETRSSRLRSICTSLVIVS